MLDGFTAEVKDFGNEFFTEDQKPDVSLRPSGTNGFELIYKFKLNGVEKAAGLYIDISAFHKTEDFKKDWINRFKNLVDIKEQIERESA